MLKGGIKTYHAKSKKDWRNWLIKNHDKEKSVWLIIYKKETDVPSVYYGDAVDEALCFGWIDSKANKRDEESYFQFFSQRNPKSKWSKVNKDKVKRLIKEGLMTEAGLKLIKLAKKSGTWTALDEVEELKIPEDLQLEFMKYKKASIFFEAFPKSVKRATLEWLSNAKKQETRQKRIEEIALKAEANIRANQYRQ